MSFTEWDAACPHGWLVTWRKTGENTPSEPDCDEHERLEER